MKKAKSSLVFILLLLCWPALILAQESWTTEQQEVLAAMARLSASTAPDGAGADDYAAVLAEEFSRWTIGGETLNGKKAWVEGVRSWFDDGWRVTDRNQEVSEVSLVGDFAFTRRIVEETNLGPDGEKTRSKAGLAETWVRVKGEWLLLRVNIYVLSSQ